MRFASDRERERSIFMTNIVLEYGWGNLFKMFEQL